MEKLEVTKAGLIFVGTLVGFAGFVLGLFVETWRGIGRCPSCNRLTSRDS